jgi:UDP-2,3-diacylglucosamine pyrophosphatase LpxH
MFTDKPVKVRSLFISDVHLGSQKSQPSKLLEVFKTFDFDNLFILGDFLDLTSMKRGVHWTQDHSLVIQKVLRLSRKGVKVVYILGNHDFYLRGLIEDGNITLGDITICDDYVWTTAAGQKLYLTHGDYFDGFVRVNRFLYTLGDISYELSMRINRVYNKLRGLLGMEYWSLSAYLKSKVKNVVGFLTQYRALAARVVADKGCALIVMGHIHTPEVSDGYVNTGDFCESCSYVVENLDGSIELKFVK